MAIALERIIENTEWSQAKLICSCVANMQLYADGFFMLSEPG